MEHDRTDRPTAPSTAPATAPDRDHARDEDGSIVTEYGLLAVVGATIAGLAIRWASGGAIFELLGAVLRRARVLVGA